MKKMTIGSAFELISKETANSKLNNDTISAIASATRFLKKNMGLTMIQCYVLSVVLENASETVTCNDLAEHAGLSPIRIMSVHEEIENLVERGFLNSVEETGRSKWNRRYSATLSFINAVRYNHNLEPIDYQGITEDGMWQMLKNYLNDCDYNYISYTCMLVAIKKLFLECKHIDFCSKVNDLHLPGEHMVLLLIVCNCLVNKSEEYVTTCEYSDILPNSVCNSITRQFKRKSCILQKKQLLEAIDSDCDCFRLTNHATLLLLGKEYLTDTINSDASDQPSAQKITAKQMFYNADEAAQIERLTNLLQQDNLVEVQNRLRNHGMRPGFCAIFYGAPGTGKTETVLQIARQTGRKIIQVDMSAIKDKYVGESEKNIQAIFTNYSEELSQSDVAPILLFNEADGIFSKRYTHVDSQAEQMGNAIQNIILQSMENFEGIMIATTNLIENLDAAFERRFLFKIEFKKPTPEVRKKIWLSMMPSLGEENASILASHFDFSGGQIENIARRIIVDNVLYDRSLTGDEILAICDEENLNKKKKFNFNKKSA